MANNEGLCGNCTNNENLEGYPNPDCEICKCTGYTPAEPADSLEDAFDKFLMSQNGCFPNEPRVRRSVEESRPGAAIRVKSFPLTESEKNELSIPFELPSVSKGESKRSRRSFKRITTTI